jgi:acetoin utilization protein AcuB
MKLSDFQHMPPVASLMTPFPHFVEPGESLERVSKLMEEHGIHHIPVKHSGAVVGLVSATAVALRVGFPGGEPSVGDLQSDAPCVIDFSVPLNEALRQLATKHADAAVVLRDGKLAGIVTATDVYEALCELLEDRFSTDSDGAA